MQNLFDLNIGAQTRKTGYVLWVGLLRGKRRGRIQSSPSGGIYEIYDFDDIDVIGQIPRPMDVVEFWSVEQSAKAIHVKVLHEANNTRDDDFIIIPKVKSKGMLSRIKDVFVPLDLILIERPRNVKKKK